MSKHYNEEEAKSILEKMKSIDIQTEKDERLLSPDVGISAARAKTNYDVLDALATGTKSRAKIKFGGVTWKFRLLSTLEYSQLDDKIAAYIATNFKRELTGEIRGYVRMACTLNMAMSSCPEANDSILTVHDIMQMDLNAFIGLFAEYMSFVEKCDFSFDEISDEKLFEVLELIEKKQLAYSDLSHRVLVRLTLFFSKYYSLYTQLEDSFPT